jgi:hypothetical protein
MGMGNAPIGAAEPFVNPVLLQVIVFTGCFFSGALAGIDIDGFVVRFPAWRNLGAAAWAAYSRKADCIYRHALTSYTETFQAPKPRSEEGK